MNVIEVFADVRCPFTHVGLRRLIEHRAALGGSFTLHVRAWPLELVNRAPLDPELIADEVDALRQQVAPDLFTGFDPDRFPASSMPALGLAADAYRCGPATGEQVSLLLREALFEHGRDIAAPGVLARIAHAAGLADASGDAAAVLDDWHEGRERGVIGSPHFFVGGEGFFCPTLQIEHGSSGFRIHRDHAELQSFLARCDAA